MDLKINEVYVFHLTNGSHLIAKLLGSEEDGLVIGRPCDLITRPVKGEPTQVGFSPYLTCANVLPALEDFFLPFGLLLMGPRQVPPDLARGYLSATSPIDVSGSLPIPKQGQSSLIR